MVISRKTCRSDKNNIGKLIASIILEKYFKKKLNLLASTFLIQIFWPKRFDGSNYNIISRDNFPFFTKISNLWWGRVAVGQIIMLKGDSVQNKTYQWLEEVHGGGSYQRGGVGVGASHPATELI